MGDGPPDATMLHAPRAPVIPIGGTGIRFFSLFWHINNINNISTQPEEAEQARTRSSLGDGYAYALPIPDAVQCSPRYGP